MPKQPISRLRWFFPDFTSARYAIAGRQAFHAGVRKRQRTILPGGDQSLSRSENTVQWIIPAINDDRHGAGAWAVACTIMVLAGAAIVTALIF